MTRKVLVTGGAGFIGSHVADAYLAAGDDVTVLDDLSIGKREQVPAGATFVQADVARPPRGSSSPRAASPCSTIMRHRWTCGAPSRIRCSTPR